MIDSSNCFFRLVKPLMPQRFDDIPHPPPTRAPNKFNIQPPSPFSLPTAPRLRPPPPTSPVPFITEPNRAPESPTARNVICRFRRNYLSRGRCVSMPQSLSFSLGDQWCSFSPVTPRLDPVA